MKDSLAQSILATIYYFDLFDYPLTLYEVWQNLINLPEYQFSQVGLSQPGSSNHYQLPKLELPINLAQVQQALASDSELQTQIKCLNGFYCLAGREGIIQERIQRYTIAERKYQRAQKIVKFFRYLPFIKLIAIVNTLAYSHSRDQSDIDLLIICQSGRLWLTRFLMVLPLKLLGLRPSLGKTKDQICLSFFITDQNLNISNLALQPEDLYLNFWVQQIIPVYDPENYSQKFFQANQWAKRLLPNALPYSLHPRRVVQETKFSSLIKRMLKILNPGFIGDFWEKTLGWWQKKILPVRLKELANKDSRVVMTDHILKFHDNDRRAEFRRKFEQKIIQHLKWEIENMK